MSTLSDDQLRGLYVAGRVTCSRCNQSLIQNYCQQCDQFFSEGHASDCPRMDPKQPWSGNHDGHRTY